MICSKGIHVHFEFCPWTFANKSVHCCFSFWSDGYRGTSRFGLHWDSFQCSEYLAVRGFTLKSTCTQLLKFFHFFARSL